LIRF